MRSPQGERSSLRVRVGINGARTQECTAALHDVLKIHIIHGTRAFEREPTIEWSWKKCDPHLCSATGKVPEKFFYKVRKDVVAPRHFKESNDAGTIGVRYVVVSLTPQRTRVQIDAVFVESAHKAVHTSDLTVEASEFKAIQEHLQANQLAEQEARDLKRRRDSAELVKKTMIRHREDESTLLASTQSSVKDLEERLKTLRHEIERRVKAPVTDLKAAPFQSSAKILTVPAYTEVVIVIVTPHWLGVENPDGQRGWIAIEQLEPCRECDQTFSKANNSTFCFGITLSVRLRFFADGAMPYARNANFQNQKQKSSKR